VDNKPRQWQEIATELTNEVDPIRIMILSKELNEALRKELRVLETPRREYPRTQSLFLFES
jgi:hypothetical protein